MDALEIRELEEWRDQLFAASFNRAWGESGPKGRHTDDSRTAERRTELLRKVIAELKCSITST